MINFVRLEVNSEGMKVLFTVGTKEAYQGKANANLRML